MNASTNATTNLSAREARALTLASSTTSHLDSAVEEDFQYALLQIREAAEEGHAKVDVPLHYSPGGPVMIRLAALGYMVAYREEARVLNPTRIPSMPSTVELSISWHDDVEDAAKPVEPAP